MKDLEYYLSLNYPIELIHIPESDGGGFSASVPLLGRLTCVGDGSTPQEAIDDLARVKRRVLSDLLKRGENVPEPEVIDDNAYSGRVLLRLPRDLHRRVAGRAEARGESTNRYIVNTLEADARARIDDLYSLIVAMKAQLDALTWRMNFATSPGNYLINYGVSIGGVTVMPSNAVMAIGRMATREPERQEPENTSKLQLVG